MLTDSTRTVFPSTRYQGSKRKLAAAILDAVRCAGLEFTTVLDAFGGTGAMAYAFKQCGKHVTYNDLLRFNHQIGLALVENDAVRLDVAEIAAVGRRRDGTMYDDFIERVFEGIYYTRAENRWLDAAVANIRGVTCRYKRAMLWFALFQAAIAKRPYNLFHRNNLYMRSADVPRGFGNKTTWDKGFDDHFRAFCAEANKAVIDGRGTCRSVCHDVLSLPGTFDLVYIDPPYISARGVGVNYREFYHFLEGVVQYDSWPAMIDYESPHRRLGREPDRWCKPKGSLVCFREVFERFRESFLVVSYRSDGIPPPEQIESALRGIKRTVRVYDLRRQKYALSTVQGTRELLFVGSSC